jgi:hypothetical protein
VRADELKCRKGQLCCSSCSSSSHAPDGACSDSGSHWLLSGLDSPDASRKLLPRQDIVARELLRATMPDKGVRELGILLYR